jgi:hypothetical protein
MEPNCGRSIGTAQRLRYEPKGLHLAPSVNLSVRKPKPLEDSTLRKSFNSREG